MERRTLLGRLSWQIGEVVATRPEFVLAWLPTTPFPSLAQAAKMSTARTKSITLDLPGWMGHRAGQHVDVRLTAEEGYQAERSYSLGSRRGTLKSVKRAGSHLFLRYAFEAKEHVERFLFIHGGSGGAVRCGDSCGPRMRDRKEESL
jgi:hypothetical protein